MESVSAEIVIDAPIEQVFKQISDVSGNRLWMQSVTETNRLDEGPLQSGSRFVESGSFLGVTVTDEKRVTVYQSPSRFAFTGEFISNGVDYQLSSVSENQTLLHATLTAEPPAALPGFAKKRIMKQTANRMQQDLKRFKQLVEEQL